MTKQTNHVEITTNLILYILSQEPLQFGELRDKVADQLEQQNITFNQNSFSGILRRMRQEKKLINKDANNYYYLPKKNSMIIEDKLTSNIKNTDDIHIQSCHTLEELVSLVSLNELEQVKLLLDKLKTLGNQISIDYYLRYKDTPETFSELTNKLVIINDLFENYLKKNT